MRVKKYIIFFCTLAILIFNSCVTLHALTASTYTTPYTSMTTKKFVCQTQLNQTPGSWLYDSNWYECGGSGNQGTICNYGNGDVQIGQYITHDSWGVLQCYARCLQMGPNCYWQ